MDRLQRVSETLPEILDQLVFVGGGVTEILLTDSAGRRPRPTKDLDCIIELGSTVEYHKLESHLRKAGFTHDREVPPLLCRWFLSDLILDVMPTTGEILGFTNILYRDAVRDFFPYQLPSGSHVNIIRPVYHFATKTEAFRNRGKGDFRASHDFEDIVILVNGREELVTEMRLAKKEVFDAMKSCWLPWIETPRVRASIAEHLDAYEESARTPIVLDRLRKMFF